MRTIVNYYDRPVSLFVSESKYDHPRLIESHVFNDDRAGLAMEKAIAKLPIAERKFILVERVPVQVEKINIMSGLPFFEEEDTPGFLSPASETYFSM